MRVRSKSFFFSFLCHLLFIQESESPTYEWLSKVISIESWKQIFSLRESGGQASRSVVPWRRRWTDKIRWVPQNGKQKHFIRFAYHHLLLISALSSFLSLMALVHRSSWWCQAPVNESFHHWKPLLKTNTFSCRRRRLWSWLPTAHYITIIFVFESFKLEKSYTFCSQDIIAIQSKACSVSVKSASEYTYVNTNTINSY